MDHTDTLMVLISDDDFFFFNHKLFSMCQNSFICGIQIETKTVIVAKDLC